MIPDAIFPELTELLPINPEVTLPESKNVPENTVPDAR